MFSFSYGVEIYAHANGTRRQIGNDWVTDGLPIRNGDYSVEWHEDDEYAVVRYRRYRNDDTDDQKTWKKVIVTFYSEERSTKQYSRFVYFINGLSTGVGIFVIFAALISTVKKREKKSANGEDEPSAPDKPAVSDNPDNPDNPDCSAE